MDANLSAHSPAAGDMSSAAAVDNDPLSDMPFIGSSDEACKECRRRKARCDRALPQCDVCNKYRRHCLYDKHSRTPLTRKHLTEVETRLERAEALLKRMRTLVPPHLRSWEKGVSAGPVPQQQPDQPFDFSAAPQPRNDEAEATVSGPSRRASTSAPIQQQNQFDNGQPPRSLEPDHQRMLEGIPNDDFEWCEKEPIRPHGLSPDGGGEAIEEESPSDGMASLVVNEKEAGYLGVASGAAMLRLLEPNSRRRTFSRSQHSIQAIAPLASQPNPNRHVAEAMIDAYFRVYHVSYPIIHEPTFRAQYSEIIPRPSGSCWAVLAYVVAALGVWTSATSSTDTLDMALFAKARSMLSFDFLELGNLTLVQALTLASNYQQKRDKPNSGYNYLGLAVRMAMGLGLHKEFQGWNISPLNMEIRRRVWWSLCVFDVGATVTFSRPDVWPYKGVEVSYPLNVNDKDLTAASTTYPSESNQITPYTAVAAQARFHIATHECYEKVISKPFPSAEELLRLDTELIGPWQAALPPFFSEQAILPPRYSLCQAVMSWRVRNLRIIMYRSFVIRRALRRRTDSDPASKEAYDRCLADAKSTIEMIADYWARQEHNRLAAWYALYFLFQAALIPCICLRNEPTSPFAADWRAQLTTTLQTITALAPVNASSGRCHLIISDLCGRYLDATQLDRNASQAGDMNGLTIENGTVDQTSVVNPWPEQPVAESLQTQINSVFSMMWPNAAPMEAANVVMGDDGWMEFLRAGSMDNWSGPNP